MRTRMDTRFAILLALLALGSCQAQYPFNFDFTRELTESINRMTEKIHENVHQLQAQIQQDLQKQLVHVNKLKEDLGKLNDSSAALIGRGNSIIINGANGVSQSIYSGRSGNGSPYHYEIENKIVDHYLYRTERIYNHNNNTVTEYKFKLDLSNPAAKPEPIEDKE